MTGRAMYLLDILANAVALLVPLLLVLRYCRDRTCLPYISRRKTDEEPTKLALLESYHT